MSRHATVRRVDPAGGVDASVIARFTAAAVPVYVGAVTLAQFDRYTHPLLALAAVVVLVTASVLLWVAAAPLRPRYPRSRFVTVMVAGLIAQLLEAFSGAGLHPLEYTHWAPLAIGLLLVAHAAFRPPAELIVAGAVAALAAVPAVVLPAPTIDATLLSALILFATPPIVLGTATAAFAASIIAATERLRRVDPLPPELEADAMQHLARAVQQDHVAVLNHEAVPLLAGILARGELTEHDVRVAERVADSMRASLVAGDHRTWLDDASERRGEVTDPEQLARWMSPEQRSAVRALLDFIGGNPGMVAESMRIELRPVAGRCAAELSWSLVRPTLGVRAQLQPYLSMLATTVDELELRLRGETLRLQFTYVR